MKRTGRVLWHIKRSMSVDVSPNKAGYYITRLAFIPSRGQAQWYLRSLKSLYYSNYHLSPDIHGSMNALTCSAVMDSVEYEYNILMYKWPNIFQNFQFIYKTTLTHTNTQCCVTVAHQAAMFSPLSGGRWSLSAHMTTLPHLSDSSSLTLAHPHPAGSAWREEKSRAREGHRFTELSQGLSDRRGFLSRGKIAARLRGESGVQRGPMKSLIMS